MASLKTVLADLAPFAMLRDSNGVIRPVCRLLEMDGDLDPDSYMREGLEPVRIHQLIEEVADPVPVLEQVLVDTHLGEVAPRLSPASRAWLAAMIEVGCGLAVEEATIAQRYVAVVSLDTMQAVAVSSLFVIAWANDNGRSSDFPTDTAIIEYLRRQVRDGLKKTQADARHDAQEVIDDALGLVKYAAGVITGLHALAVQLLPGNVPDRQLRAAASRLVAELEAAKNRLVPKQQYEVPEIVGAPARRRRRGRRARFIPNSADL